ncbi:MAG: hypothetical protein ACK5UE_14350 [Chitinophagales bacterium]|jgi:hypothetical protein|nr:hypothetical protein [Sphingobacteriales bacterium]
MGRYLNWFEYKSILPFLIFPFLVCIVSWIHFYQMGNLLVDGSPVNPLYLRLALMALICGSFVYYYSRLYSLLILSSEIELHFDIRRLSYMHLIISVFTLPLFSNDFFSLLGYADAFVNGHNIYTSFNAKGQTEYAALINPLYQNLNCKYGPLNMLIMLPSVLWNQHSIITSIFISKSLLFIFGVFYIEFSLKLSRLLSKDFIYILLLFPIWFIQGVGQFHLDLIGVCFVLIGYYYCYKNKSWIGIFFLVLAVLSKITYLLFLCIPYLLLLERQKKMDMRAWLQCTILNLIYLSVLGYLAYAPFIDHWKELLAPIRAMNVERPSSTMADIGAYILLPWNNDFKANYTITMTVFKYLGLLVMLGITSIYFKNYSKKYSHRIFLLSIFITLILVYSHRFLPWYLMVVPLFLYIGDRKDWLKWFLWISFISMFQDFAIFMQTDWLGGKIMMALATIGTVGCFFYHFQSRIKYTE